MQLSVAHIFLQIHPLVEGVKRGRGSEKVHEVKQKST